MSIYPRPCGEEDEDEDEAGSALIAAAFRYLQIKAHRRDLKNRTCAHCQRQFDAPGVDVMVGYEEGGSIVTLGLVHPHCAEMMNLEQPPERVTIERTQ